MKWLQLAGALLEGVGEAAKEINRTTAAAEARERELAREREINIKITQQQQPRYTAVDYIFASEPEIKSTIEFGYSLNELKQMTTEELRNEIKAIFTEHASIFSQEYDKGKTARKLYYDTTRNYSESRYRAKLIKFLYEEGNI